MSSVAGVLIAALAAFIVYARHQRLQWRRLLHLRPMLHPLRGSVKVEGKRVFAAHDSDASVSVTGTSTNPAVATIPFEQGPWNVALTAGGAKLEVACRRSRSRFVIDMEQDVKILDIPLGQAARGRRHSSIREKH